MTEAVFQFKAIARKLNRQEQKAEFEEKNPPIPDTSMYGWPYGVAVPYTDRSALIQSQADALVERLVDAYRITGGGGLSDWLNKSKI
jgi:hypothetical protein